MLSVVYTILIYSFNSS